MKKLLMLLVTLVGILILIGCSSQSTPSSPARTGSTQAISPASTQTATVQTTSAQPNPTQTTSAATYKLRLETFCPDSENVYTIVLPHFVKAVSDYSNGRIEIATFGGGSIVPPNTIFNSVSQGIIDMGLDTLSYNMGDMPFVVVLDGLPFTWPNDTALLDCMNNYGLLDLAQQQFESRGVHFLGGGMPAQNSFLTDKPLRTQADFKGMKIRGYGAWNPYIDDLGGSSVNMPLPDVYTAMTTHTVDGAATGISAFLSLKLYESAKYLLAPWLSTAMCQDFIINLKTWNSLPPDMQDALNKAMLDEEKWMSTDYDTNYNSKYPEQLEAKGVQKVTVDQQTLDWMKSEAVTLQNQFAEKGPVAAKAISIMNNYLKQKGYLK